MAYTDLILDLAVRYGFQVLGALLILAGGFLLAGWTGKVAQRWLAHHDLEPPVRMLIVRLAKGVVLLFTAIVALDKFGVQVGPLIAGVGVVGLGVGLAMQGVLTNVFAGLTIIFTKPYRVGEYIEVVGVHGQVSIITLFSTTLTHLDQSLVVIPNGKIVGEILHNYGTMKQLVLSVGVAYDTNLSEAIGAVRRVLDRSPRVLKEPAPLVGVGALGDSAITLTVQPWVRVDGVVQAQGELYQALVEECRACDIAIPFPQREVRLLGGS